MMLAQILSRRLELSLSYLKSLKEIFTLSQGEFKRQCKKLVKIAVYFTSTWGTL